MTRLVNVIFLLVFVTTTAQAGLREASVKIRNTKTGDTGSGVLVSSDKDCYYGLTSGHMFEFDESQVGKLFDIETKDHFGTGKLLAISPKNLDIAVFSVQRIKGLDIVPIATSAPDSKKPFILTGFPQGGKYKQVSVSLNQENDFVDPDQTPLYAFDMDEKNPMGAGVSGGAVTQNGKLYTTISAGDDVKTFACEYKCFRKFVAMNYSNCYGGTCRNVRLIQQVVQVPLTQSFVSTQVQIPPPASDEVAVMQNEIAQLKSQMSVLSSTMNQLASTVTQLGQVVAQAGQQQSVVAPSTICPTCPPVSMGGFSTGGFSSSVSYGAPRIISSRIISSYTLPSVSFDEVLAGPQVSSGYSMGGFSSGFSGGYSGGISNGYSVGSIGSIGGIGGGIGSVGGFSAGPSMMAAGMGRTGPIVVVRARGRLGKMLLLKSLMN